jgi:chloramphenicol O-acetyltransferase type A
MICWSSINEFERQSLHQALLTHIIEIAYNPGMPRHLNLETWPRRETFEFFRKFDKPYFNVATHLDVTGLVALRGRPHFTVFLGYHYLALRIANEIECFRYRLTGGQVIIHDVIHGASTILLPNETIAFAYFDYYEEFETFALEADRLIAEVRSGDGTFKPREDHDAVIHFTTLPWVSFTSFSHARNWGREDSVPKIAFGKFTNEDGHIRLPVSVEVHHALMDGLHVGRFLTRLEEAMREPLAYLK